MEITDTYEATYGPKIREILETVRAEALERGLLCDEPCDMTDEDVRWSALVQPAGTEPDAEGVGADVNITVAESEHWDGHEGGVNFILDVVGVGGEIIGGLAPYNYTDDCWVERTDEDAVETRWVIFSNGCDADAIVDSIEEFFARE